MAANRCSVCGFESDNFPDFTCPQCGKKLLSSSPFSPWIVVVAQVIVTTGFMFIFHFPRPVIIIFGLIVFLFSALGLRRRRNGFATRKSPPLPLSSQPASVVLLGLAVAVLGIVFVACLLFGSVALINSYNAVARVQGQPYHATIFQVIRPYYQKSAGMHGPYIQVYASGMVEGDKEWMSLIPYLKQVPHNQAELNDLVPPGTEIPVYLFSGLKGRSRIQVNDGLPPGEASRRTETWVLSHVPLALVVLAVLIFLLVRIRRSCVAPAAQPMTVNA